MNQSIIQLKLPYCTRVPSMIFLAFIVRTPSPLPQVSSSARKLLTIHCYVEEPILHNSPVVFPLNLMKSSTFKMRLKGVTLDFLSQQWCRTFYSVPNSGLICHVHFAVFFLHLWIKQGSLGYPDFLLSCSFSYTRSGKYSRIKATELMSRIYVLSYYSKARQQNRLLREQSTVIGLHRRSYRSFAYKRFAHAPIAVKCLQYA